LQPETHFPLPFKAYLWAVVDFLYTNVSFGTILSPALGFLYSRGDSCIMGLYAIILKVTNCLKYKSSKKLFY